MTQPVGGRAPRPLVLLAAAAVAAGVTMTAVGAWRTGVSWDETYHVVRMRNYLDAGWYLLDGDLLGDEPGSWEDQRYVYGPATMGLAHLWSMLWGVEGPGQVSASADAFAVRHLVVVGLSLAGVAAAATTTRLLTRQWGWAVVTAGVLVALPTWTGHAMFNVKDVPVATGYALVTLGVAVVHLTSRRSLEWAGAATLVAGIVLAVGTRPGIWPGIVLAGTPAVLVALRARDVRRLVILLVAVAAACSALLLLYPDAFRDPVDALLGSALESSRYGGTPGNWWYLPLFLVIELPTLHLLLGALGTVVALRLLRHGALPERTRVVVVMVLLQAFALPVLAVLRESNLYNGLRQLLFAAPALAVLVALGIRALLADSPGRSTPVRRAAPVLVGLAFVGPLVAQAQLFPYNYAYSSVPANALAPLVADRGRAWEVPTDYWRTSVRELAPHIPQGGLVVCSPSYDDEDRFVPYSHEGHQDCATDLIGPLSPYDDLRAATWSQDPTDFLAVDTGTEFVGDNCERLAEVTRRLYWRTVTMSYVARCDLVLEPYPSEGLTFTGAGTGGAVLLTGWSSHRAEPGIGLVQASGSLGVTLPERLRGDPLELRVTLTDAAAADLQLWANGVQVPLETDGDDVLRADLGTDVVEAYGAGRLVLTFVEPDPTGGVRLTGLRLEATS